MLITVVLITELTEVILQIYWKMLIWPKKEEYYKYEKIHKYNKEIITFGDIKLKNTNFTNPKAQFQ